MQQLTEEGMRNRDLQQLSEKRQQNCRVDLVIALGHLHVLGGEFLVVTIELVDGYNAFEQLGSILKELSLCHHHQAHETHASAKHTA